MSIYSSNFVLAADDGDGPAPIIYQGSHVLPDDSDQRGGTLDLGVIPGWIERPGRPATNNQGRAVPLHPWLRITINDESVVLDRAQVAALTGHLREWLLWTTEREA